MNTRNPPPRLDLVRVAAMGRRIREGTFRVDARIVASRLLERAGRKGLAPYSS
jgi:anti-sigma28 factor (negative regulator of flagellin synthesis)